MRAVSYIPIRTDGLYLLPRGLGILLALEILRLWNDLPLLFGQDTVIDPVLHHYWHTGTGWSMAEFIQPLPPYTLYLMAGAYILFSLLLLYPRTVRLASLLLLVLHQAFFLSDYRWSYGVDYLAQTGLFFCLCFYPGHNGDHPSGWLRSGSLLWQCHIVLIYFFGGLGKAIGADWWNGEALWKALHHPFVGHLGAIPLSWANYPVFWTIVGIGIVLVELLYPLIWLGQRSRVLFMTAVIGMHIGIAIFLGLYHFAALMIWYNLCAWHLPYQESTKYIVNPLETDLPGVTSSTRTDRFSIQGEEVDT